MWRLAHDPVRHVLHARKACMINAENIILEKGVPMKIVWLKKGDHSASTQSSSNASNCSVSAALGSADGIAEPPVA